MASGASTYSWVFVGAGATVQVTPTLQTTYTVIGVDQNACSNTATVLIRVANCIDGIAESGIPPFTIHVYPNPSSGELNISSEVDLELELVNELGQLIGKIELNQKNNHRTSMNNLSPGVYFLNSKDPAKKVNRKIVVQ